MDPDMRVDGEERGATEGYLRTARPDSFRKAGMELSMERDGFTIRSYRYHAIRARLVSIPFRVPITF
jgi:hypothetical protein